MVCYLQSEVVLTRMSESLETPAKHSCNYVPSYVTISNDVFCIDGF
jgi:hypothetical protein